MVKPGYKQTEVGVVPEDWEVKKIKELNFEISDGNYSSKYPRSSEFKAFGIPFIRANNIKAMQVVDTDMRFISEEKHQELLKGHLKKNDILITTRGEIGQIALVPDRHIESNINAQLVRINTKEQEIYFKYLAYFLLKQETQERLISMQTGSALKQLPVSKLITLEIAFPALAEQQTITAVLSDVDALITGLDKLIAKKRDVKTAVMQVLLTGEKRLPGFGNGRWEEVQLGSMGTFSKGKGIKKDDVIDHGLPCIRYGEIYTKHNDHIKNFYSFIPAHIALESQRLKQGDLLFAGSGETAEEIGKCVAFLADIEAYAGGDMVIFSPKGQDSMFLGYLMNHSIIVNQKSKMGQGDAVVHIQAKNLAQLQFLLPPPNEQHAIGTILSDMDTEITALETRRAKTQAIKQGMMQELLTGRTRLL